MIDQGVVSLGNFSVNIFIARQLAPSDYGTFALLMGGLYALQIVNSSLIFYPMSVRMAVSHGDDEKVLGAALRLFVLFLSPLCILLVLTLFAFDLSRILPATLAYFTLWQLQEALRRGLFARFRIKAAIIGDTVSYLGQIGIIFGLIAAGSLSLPNLIWGMAATSGLAAVIQARQLRLSLRGPLHLRLVLIDFWSIGSWSLANNLISYLRFYIFIGMLGFGWGAAAAASFQAVLNVLNLANPVIMGLCNIIPQTVARARAGGGRLAWSSARPYILLGVPPIFLYYAVTFTASDFVLHVFYGPMSPYVELSLPLRILAIAFAVSYGVEMICSFLHGIDAPRLALVINTIGLIPALILVFPFTSMFGLVGSCAALAIANAARLVTSLFIIARTTADEPHRLS
ncbi:MAG: polysaccharide biosynthesis C-terminal domain-containing protein [Methylocella sp.]